MAFAPMANGFLSGKYTPGEKFASNDIRDVIISRYCQKKIGKSPSEYRLSISVKARDVKE